MLTDDAPHIQLSFAQTHVGQYRMRRRPSARLGVRRQRATILAGLMVLTGTAFDNSYIKGMIKYHEVDIKEFQKEAASGRDPEARAFAKATLRWKNFLSVSARRCTTNVRASSTRCFIV